MSNDMNHHIKIYRNVFIGLLFLTGFTVGASYVDFDRYPHLKDNPDYKNNFEESNTMVVADNVKMKKGLFYFIDDNGDVCSTDKEHIYEAWNDWIEQNAVYDKKVEYESQQALEDEKIEKRLELRKNIINNSLLEHL